MFTVIVTAALFSALILLDLLRHEYQLLPAHTFFGIICVLAMSILEQKNHAIVGWGLLLTPLVILLIGWGMIVIGYDPRLKPYPTKLRPLDVELELNIP
jgi:hypothetical protein